MHEQIPASSEVLMVCSASCKHLHGFITGLYRGKWDYVFSEMEESQHKKRNGAAYAEHGKFHLGPDLDVPFKRETLQAENAVKFAAGILQPGQLGAEVGAAAASSQGAASSEGAVGSHVQDVDEMLEDVNDDDKESKD